MADRVITLIDMDCFYVQVEQRLRPELYGKPCAVVQYNGGGIIAVNYEARDLGVTRHSRGVEAKKICPSLILVRVPEINRKADLTKYRDAGKEVIDVLSKFAKCVERASIDEAYIDLTKEVDIRLNSSGGSQVTSEHLPTSYVVGWDKNDNMTDSEAIRKTGLETWLNDVYEDNLEEEYAKSDRRLAIAAAIVEEMRAAVLVETKFRCSAGIGHNKMLSKLACGLHKPNRQTIIPRWSVPHLFESLPLKKVRNLGGKLGTALVEQLKCETMADIAKHPLQALEKHFGEKSGQWLFDLCRGIDLEPVKSRHLPQSIGCSKNFPGKSALSTTEDVKLWLQRLSLEIEERVNSDREANNRIPKTLSVHASYSLTNSVSRACSIPSYKADRIALSSYTLLQKLNTSTDKSLWEPAITSLGMAVSKFQEFSGKSTTILENFFKPNHASALKRSAEEQESDKSSDLIRASDLSRLQSNASSISLNTSTDKSLWEPAITSPEMAVSKFQEFSGNSTTILENFFKPNHASALKRSAEEQDSDKTSDQIKASDSSRLQSNASSTVNYKNQSAGFFRSLKIKQNIEATERTKVEEKPDKKQSIAKMFSKNAPTGEGDAISSHSSHLPLDANEIDNDVLSCLPDDIKDEIIRHFSTKLVRESNTAIAGPKGLEKTSTLTKCVTSTEVSSENAQPSTSGYTGNAAEISDLKESTPHAEIPVDSDRNNDENSMSPSDCIMCAKCNEWVMLRDLFEHNDYHLALDLRNEMRNGGNLAINKTANVSSSKNRNESIAKRKRRGRPKKGPENGAEKKIRSISSYFASENVNL